MSHAEKCPVCLGDGTMELDDKGKITEKKCWGCEGKGWVTVHDNVQYQPTTFPTTFDQPFFPQFPWTGTTTTTDTFTTSTGNDLDPFATGAGDFTLRGTDSSGNDITINFGSNSTANTSGINWTRNWSDDEKDKMK